MNSTAHPTVRIFLVDDHEMVRRGVADTLERESGFEIVGEAANAAQARSRIPAVRPDVVVLDVQLPDGSGIDVCRFLREVVPTTRCLIFTSHNETTALHAAVLAGAAGYAIKDIYGGKLVESVRAVGAGRSLIDPSTRQRAQAELLAASPVDPALGRLTTRQREVLWLIAEGLSNRQIGTQMGLAEKTIKNYVSDILSELGLERRTQAALVGLDSRRAFQPDQDRSPHPAPEFLRSVGR
jgi:DNA-binding NarL/FixJ family response regulator